MNWILEDEGNYGRKGRRQGTSHRKNRIRISLKVLMFGKG